MKRLIIISIVVLSLGACSQEDQVTSGNDKELANDGTLQEKATSPEEAIENFEKMTPSIGSFAPRFPEGVNAREFDEEHGLRRKHFELTRMLLEKKDEDWKAKQQVIQSYISGAKTSETAFFYDQVEALKMINVLLDEKTVSGDVSEELGKYTQVLLDYKYNLAYPVVESLKKLEGHWSKERIKNAALATFEQASKLQRIKEQAIADAVANGKLSSSRLSAKKPAGEIMQEQSMSELQAMAN